MTGPVDADAIREADAAANGLLMLYEDLGVSTVILQFRDGVVLARCQTSGDVLPLCKAVVNEYETPEGRSLN